MEQLVSQLATHLIPLKLKCKLKQVIWKIRVAKKPQVISKQLKRSLKLKESKVFIEGGFLHSAVVSFSGLCNSAFTRCFILLQKNTHDLMRQFQVWEFSIELYLVVYVRGLQEQCQNVHLSMSKLKDKQDKLGNLKECIKALMCYCLGVLVF